MLEEYVARADKVKDLTKKVKEMKIAKVNEQAENFKKASEETNRVNAQILLLIFLSEFFGCLCFNIFFGLFEF